MGYAYEIEQNICKRFEAIGGIVYFLLSDDQLDLFNTMFDREKELIYLVVNNDIQNSIDQLKNNNAELTKLTKSFEIATMLSKMENKMMNIYETY